jgi:PKD repeat protein
VPASSGPANQPPVARATATPASGTAPLAVAFDGSSSSDTDGTIASYGWTFGDGGTATGPAPNHTYANAGNYSAQLTVTDNQGATGTSTVAISVTPGLTRPAAPSGLTGSVATGRVVTLRWTDNASNETGFYVERAAKAKILQFVRVATLGANATTCTRTENADTWVYRVQAVNGAGVSGYSNNVTVRVR